MTYYTYRATWQRKTSGVTSPEAIRVLARDIHSGFHKAMQRALKDRLADWELVSLEFWTTSD